MITHDLTLLIDLQTDCNATGLLNQLAVLYSL